FPYPTLFRSCSEERLEPRGSIVPRLARTLHVFVRRRIDRVEITEIVLRKITHIDVRVIGESFVRQYCRPLRVLTVCVLELADCAVDDQLRQRGITELAFLDCTGILDAQN